MNDAVPQAYGRAAPDDGLWPSIFQMVADCSWWLMVDRRLPSGPLLLSPVTLRPRAWRETFLYTPAHLAPRHHCLGAPSVSGHPRDLLAGEGLFQSVR